MGERFVIISDTQIPYDDRRALTAVVGFIGAYQPDQVIHIGNLLDYPTPARWTKGAADEFAQRIKPDAEQAKARFLGPAQGGLRRPGRHPRGQPRPSASRVPAQVRASLRRFRRRLPFENLLDFDGFGVEVLPEFYKVAPGWVTTHGHRGGIRLTQKAGDTALNAAIRFNTSIVMGHTHRLGLKPEIKGTAALSPSRCGAWRSAT